MLNRNYMLRQSRLWFSIASNALFFTTNIAFVLSHTFFLAFAECIFFPSLRFACLYLSFFVCVCVFSFCHLRFRSYSLNVVDYNFSLLLFYAFIVFCCCCSFFSLLCLVQCSFCCDERERYCQDTLCAFLLLPLHCLSLSLFQLGMEWAICMLNSC